MGAMEHAPTTARARARIELTREIKGAARRQLAEGGPSALSLRAVARELGMVSSAVYRYFASRDDLITALVIDSYDSLGGVAEEAVDDARGDFEARWLRLTRAIRGWALANPNEYALIYGSPVPGYQAPQDTIAAATRTVAAGCALVVAGVASGEIDVDQALPIPRPVRADLAAVRNALAPDVPDSVLSRTLYAWAQLFGTLTFELFGQYENVIGDRDEFFDHQMRRTARLLLTGG
jgi:AcrR family transcriptional regulator